VGELDIKLANLTITIHNREFPASEDYWDGNWVNVTVVYRDYYSTTIKIHGPILHLSELIGFLKDCERLYETLKGNAVLDPIEPNLRIELNVKKRGNIQMLTSITPNQLTQKHEMFDEIDQSYLSEFITGLRTVLEEYPIQNK
jgi:hypothetical protein